MTDQGDTENVDDVRISDLPDDILCLILSFLTIRDEARTRILSRRWRHLCSFSTNLCFDDLSIFADNCGLHSGMSSELILKLRSQFIMGVDQYLQLFPGPRLTSFKIHFDLDNESKSHIDRWISFALGMEAREISLSLAVSPDRYNFPCHLLVNNGKTSHLKYLILHSCTLTPAPQYAERLNSLVTLQLGHVPLNQFNLDCILTGCLNLEELTLWCCSLTGNFRIFGPSLHLKSLIIYNCSGFDYMELSSLEKLNIFEYTGSRESIAVTGAPSLKTVYFNISNWRGWGTRYIFNRTVEYLQRLEILSLLLFPFGDQLIPERMTTFRHLKQLDLYIAISSQYDLLNIVHILNAAPSLQKFHFGFHYRHDYTVTTCTKLENKHPHWQLKEVEIFGFSDESKSNEMDLVVYLLNNCIALERMTLCRRRKILDGPGRWLYLNQIPKKLNCEAVLKFLLPQRVNPKAEIVFL